MKGMLVALLAVAHNLLSTGLTGKQNRFNCRKSPVRENTGRRKNKF